MYILSKSYGKTDTQLFLQQQVGVRKMSALASNLQVCSFPLLWSPIPPGTVYPGQLPSTSSAPPPLSLDSHALDPSAIAPQSTTSPAALPQGLLRGLDPGPEGQWDWICGPGDIFPAFCSVPATQVLSSAIFSMMHKKDSSCPETSTPGVKAIFGEPQRQEKEGERRCSVLP